MGNFSEKHPKLADFLKNKAPKVLSAIGDVYPPAKIISNLINTLHPELSDDDKLKAQNLLDDYELARQKEEDDADAVEQQELTKRLQADMQSDSNLSKNIRPIELIYLSVIITTLSILDSCNIGFTVKPIWVNVFQYAWMAALLFYFGSRGVEKVVKMWTSK